MTDKHVQAEAPHSNMQKDPSDWVTGDEPMTGAQKSYLKTLSEEAGTEFDESLTKAAASEQIEALQQETGRGSSGHASSGPGAATARPTASPTRTADASDDDGAQHRNHGGKQKVVTDEASEGDLFEEKAGEKAASH